MAQCCSHRLSVYYLFLSIVVNARINVDVLKGDDWAGMRVHCRQNVSNISRAGHLNSHDNVGSSRIGRFGESVRITVDQISFAFVLAGQISNGVPEVDKAGTNVIKANIGLNNDHDGRNVGTASQGERVGEPLINSLVALFVFFQCFVACRRADSS